MVSVRRQYLEELFLQRGHTDLHQALRKDKLVGFGVLRDKKVHGLA